MNWFTQLFGPKPLSQSDRDFFDACDAFATGGGMFQEAVSQTAFYEMLLPTEAEIISRKRISSDKKFIEEDLKKIKRREG
jgi:hypothetical protein